MSDIEFCGKCNRQQERSRDGEKCKVCGCPTVTWVSYETAEQVMEKWKKLWGARCS